MSRPRTRSLIDLDFEELHQFSRMTNHVSNISGLANDKKKVSTGSLSVFQLDIVGFLESEMCLHLPDTGIREFFCILICGDGCLILFSKEMLPCTQEAIIFLLLACKQEPLSVQLSYRFFQVYKVILLFCLTIQMRMDTPRGLSI